VSLRMKLRVTSAAAPELGAGRGKRLGVERAHRRFLLRVSAIAAISCAFYALAWGQTGTRKKHAAQPGERPPYWAYAVNPPATAPAVRSADQLPQHVPGSPAQFSAAQISDLFEVPDWHPDAHPGMPEIVARGRKPEIFACGYCHLPNGQGRPENSSLAGLPVDYIVQQMADFKSGLRKSSEPRHLPVATMIARETKANKSEIQAAAEYFAGLKPKVWIRVVETENVPKTVVAGWMLVASEPAGTEPVGDRAIEMAEDLERTELRDDASGFVAYVPVGSIERGKALVTTGGAGKTVPCGLCHGADLGGKGNVPSIAGRSPSYVVRQLYDIRNGARRGAAAQRMKPAVRNLTMVDMISIAAYAASLRPR
jgi:cytochrome c553